MLFLLRGELNILTIFATPLGLVLLLLLVLEYVLSIRREEGRGGEKEEEREEGRGGEKEREEVRGGQREEERGADRRTRGEDGTVLGVPVLLWIRK